MIIKLKFRFYHPEECCNKLDDVNLKEYAVFAEHLVSGFLFYDYVTYGLQLREIIALSDIDAHLNDDKLKKVFDIRGANKAIQEWKMTILVFSDATMRITE